MKKGVRQGDPLSSKPLTPVLEYAINKTELGRNRCQHIWKMQNHLRFADDIVLVASSEEELGEMLKQLDEVLTEVELKMNRAKTKIMTKLEDERGTQCNVGR
ncbi:MAG: reverse transcriptase domain-containing protein [Candidatus Arsenophonus phytopathogenicus]